MSGNDFEALLAQNELEVSRYMSFILNDQDPLFSTVCGGDHVPPGKASDVRYYTGASLPPHHIRV